MATKYLIKHWDKSFLIPRFSKINCFSSCVYKKTFSSSTKHEPETDFIRDTSSLPSNVNKGYVSDVNIKKSECITEHVRHTVREATELIGSSSVEKSASHKIHKGLSDEEKEVYRKSFMLPVKKLIDEQNKIKEMECKSRMTVPDIGRSQMYSRPDSNIARENYSFVSKQKTAYSFNKKMRNCISEPKRDSVTRINKRIQIYNSEPKTVSKFAENIQNIFEPEQETDSKFNKKILYNHKANNIKMSNYNARPRIFKEDELYASFSAWNKVERSSENADSKDEKQQDESDQALPRVYHPIVSIVDELSCCKGTRKALSFEEWKIVDEKAKSFSFDSLTKFWPSILMEYLLMECVKVPGTAELAKSLFSYIEKANNVHWTNSTALTVQFIYLHSLIGSEEIVFLPMYNELMQKTSGLMDCKSADRLFVAISKTSQWKKECPRLLEIIKEWKKPSHKVLSAYVEAHLRNGEKLEAENLLIFMSHEGKIPTYSTFKHILEYDQSDWPLKLIQQCNWIIPQTVAEMFSKYFSSRG